MNRLRTLPERRLIALWAGQDAGNRSMRRGGRKVWNEEDYNAANAERDRLDPEPQPEAKP